MRKVLVLLSTYNGANYIREQYESIKNQENIEVDVMIRDDGSSDSTIEELQDLGVDNFYVGENKGPFNSFYELIMSAPEKYDYFAFSDQDDIWHKDKLFIAVSELDKSDKQIPALYYCGQTIADCRLKTLYIHRMDAYRSRYTNCIFNQMAGCTSVFNKALLRILKKETPRIKLGHDAWVYRLCAMIDGDIYVDEEPHIIYRQHKENVVGLLNNSKSKLKRAKDYIFTYEPSLFASELLRIHKDIIHDKEKEFLNDIIQCNSSNGARQRLLHNYNIDFHRLSLNALFRLKLFLRKM